MTFNEANTVEAFIRDRLAGSASPANVAPGLARRGGAISGLGWHFVGPADLPRQAQEALVEPYLRDALIRLNPDIAANPSRVDDVLYRLRAIVMSARSDGLVKANEEFAAWMLGERSMPFGADGQHVTIRLIDFDDIENNSFVVTQQFTFRAGKTEKRPDLMLLVNGLPLVLIEAKTPVRSSQSWLDGALQVHDDYEQNVPELFVPNVFSVATEGNDERRDAFASDFSILSRIWEALSPDPVLTPHEQDYRWLAQVYESLKPSTGTGRLLWHRLGAKTIELIHENVHVDAVRDDLDTLVMDAELLEAVLGNPDPEKKAKEVSVKLTGRLRKHTGNPQYKALAERLEDLKNRHQQGLLLSIDFLKELLELAKDVVKMERETPVEDDIDRGKAALTELFENAKNGETPIMVKRVVDDIDEIVRAVRFDGWQATHAGEREVKKALRQTLFKYKLHQDAELFERAYGYIREYY